MQNFYKFTFIILFSFCAKAQVATTAIVSASSIFCTGASLGFSAVTTETAPTFSWTVSPLKYITIGPDNTSASITFTPSNVGTYTVTLKAVSPETTQVVTKTINVAKSPKASFNASLSGQGFPAQLMLTDYSSGSIKNYWVFDNNISQMDSSSTLTKNYTAGGSYSVTLIAKAPGGCTDMSGYAFRISDSSGVTLPNIFSPNNDGVNDIFKPLALGVVNINAWVYNRNGIIIASWDKINGFWDGYTTSGELCTAGEYFVVVEALGFDGKQYKIKGNLTLIR